ncbi:unnamed protein product [Larinioides sclopetarius]|uniref:Uncharacterized protein n=1 Tax=Larinioides sclopetarius TaxID=280406 RepID=A0AAV2AB82_9ARAC
MNCSLEAKFLAEDLMKYVFEKRGLSFALKSDYAIKRHREFIGMSPFRLVIGNAVCIGISENMHELFIMFRQEFESRLDVISFRRHAMKLVPEWFPEGYHPICFIEFCVMMISTAISFHDAGYHEISSCVSEVIATVLNQQMLTDQFKKNGGWESLVKVSTELVILHRQARFGHRK